MTSNEQSSDPRDPRAPPTDEEQNQRRLDEYLDDQSQEQQQRADGSNGGQNREDHDETQLPDQFDVQSQNGSVNTTVQMDNSDEHSQNGHEQDGHEEPNPEWWNGRGRGDDGNRRDGRLPDHQQNGPRGGRGGRGQRNGGRGRGRQYGDGNQGGGRDGNDRGAPDPNDTIEKAFQFQNATCAMLRSHFDMQLGIQEQANLVLRKQLEMQNPSKFTKRFTGNRDETLEWVSAAKRFLRTNNFTDPEIRFQRIHDALDEEHRNAFALDFDQIALEHEADVAAGVDVEANAPTMTVERLTKWLIKSYTPQSSKHRFLQRLRTCIMRKNEAPWLAFRRFNRLLMKMQRAIELINQANTERNKIEPITETEIVDALEAVFVRNNNLAHHKNEGWINKKIVSGLCKLNSRKFKEWKKYLEDTEKTMLNRLHDQVAAYRPVTYAPDASDLSIYPVKKRKARPDTEDWRAAAKKRPRLDPNQQNGQQWNDGHYGARGGGGRGGRGRGRGRGRGGRTRSQSAQLRSYANARGQGCFKCGGSGHVKANCTSVAGNPRQCFRCSGFGHEQRDCPSDPQNVGHVRQQQHQQQRQRQDQRNQDGTGTCSRCHRPGHKRNDCFATTTRDGEILTDKPPKPKPRDRYHRFNVPAPRGRELNLISTLEDIKKMVGDNQYIRDEDAQDIVARVDKAVQRKS